MSTAPSRTARRLDYVRFLGIERSEAYKEWHIRLEVKDSATAILQSVTVGPGRKPRLLDPKSRSYSFKVAKINPGAAGAVAFALLEMTDGGTQRIELGQVMLRDALNPEWRYYHAPESDERFKPGDFA
jgi:hypothetical protein